jgi:hypothetical protein
VLIGEPPGTELADGDREGGAGVLGHLAAHPGPSASCAIRQAAAQTGQTARWSRTAASASGAGGGASVIDAGGLGAPDRVLHVQPGASVDVIDVGITGGWIDNNIYVPTQGGGILNEGTAPVLHSDVSGNFVNGVFKRNSGGGIANTGTGGACTFSESIIGDPCWAPVFPFGTNLQAAPGCGLSITAAVMLGGLGGARPWGSRPFPVRRHSERAPPARSTTSGSSHAALWRARSAPSSRAATAVRRG